MTRKSTGVGQDKSGTAGDGQDLTRESGDGLDDDQKLEQTVRLRIETSNVSSPEVNWRSQLEMLKLTRS